MTSSIQPGIGFRWRSLDPHQSLAIFRAFASGVRAADLAREYGVSVRTIYRVLRRDPEQVAVVQVFDYKATFVMGEDGEPVRLTTWVPA